MNEILIDNAYIHPRRISSQFFIFGEGEGKEGSRLMSRYKI